MTEPHVGYSKDQIAQAVLDTELDTTPANAVVIDAVEKFCPPLDHRELHDVFIVISEGWGGGHIVRTVYAADRRRRAPNTPGQLRRRAPRGGSPINHPGSSHSAACDVTPFVCMRKITKAAPRTRYGRMAYPLPSTFRSATGTTTSELDPGRTGAATVAVSELL